MRDKRTKNFNACIYRSIGFGLISSVFLTVIKCIDIIFVVVIVVLLLSLIINRIYKFNSISNT